MIFNIQNDLAQRITITKNIIQTEHQEIKKIKNKKTNKTNKKK